MKLILTTDVANLGAPGDLVEVKDGYGRNYLLPRGLAVIATKGAEKQVATIRRARQAREIRGLDHANEVKAALDAAEAWGWIEARGPELQLLDRLLALLWKLTHSPTLPASQNRSARTKRTG